MNISGRPYFVSIKKKLRSNTEPVEYLLNKTSRQNISKRGLIMKLFFKHMTKVITVNVSRRSYSANIKKKLTVL